jgi:FecR protein
METCPKVLTLNALVHCSAFGRTAEASTNSTLATWAWIDASKTVEVLVNHMFDKCKRLPTLLSILAISSVAVFAEGVVPGTLNYEEGSVSLNGQGLTAASIGKTSVGENQVLTTAQGKAEMLLTPGVFLRLGENSSVRMLSPNLTDTRVALLRGEATVEVTELFKENDIQVAVGGFNTKLLKRGLYEFNADHPQVAVYDGEASVATNDKQVNVKQGHEAQLTGAVQQAKFDRKTQQDQLYAWSNLRSEYEAQASAESAQIVYAGGGPYWYGPGWYWNPWWDAYGFLPGDGILYSPFGWPFFSPGYAFYAPGFFRGRGFAGRGFAGRAPTGGFARGLAAPHVSGGFAGGGHMGGGFAAGGHMGGGGGHR